LFLITALCRMDAAWLLLAVAATRLVTLTAGTGGSFSPSDDFLFTPRSRGSFHRVGSGVLPLVGAPVGGARRGIELYGGRDAAAGELTLPEPLDWRFLLEAAAAATRASAGESIGDRPAEGWRIFARERGFPPPFAITEPSFALEALVGQAVTDTIAGDTGKRQ
jgi:hypothetical protein